MNKLKITILNSEKSSHEQIFADFGYIILCILSHRCCEFHFSTFLFHVRAFFWLILPAYQYNSAVIVRWVLGVYSIEHTWLQRDAGLTGSCTPDRWCFIRAGLSNDQPYNIVARNSMRSSHWSPSRTLPQYAAPRGFWGALILAPIIYGEPWTWKTLHRLSERLACLGILGVQFRIPLKPFKTIVLWWTERFQGVPQLGSHDAERRKSLEQLYVWWYTDKNSATYTTRLSESLVFW